MRKSEALGSPWGRETRTTRCAGCDMVASSGFLFFVICGRPLLASAFLQLRTIWSASVICPAFWCGTMTAGPDDFRLPRSLSLRRALRLMTYGGVSLAFGGHRIVHHFFRTLQSLTG